MKTAPSAAYFDHAWTFDDYMFLWASKSGAPVVKTNTNKVGKIHMISYNKKIPGLNEGGLKLLVHGVNYLLPISKFTSDETKFGDVSLKQAKLCLPLLAKSNTPYRKLAG